MYGKYMGNLFKNEYAATKSLSAGEIFLAFSRKIRIAKNVLFLWQVNF